MVWSVKFDPAASRELSKLDPKVARPIPTFLNERVALLDDPCSIGECLKGFRLREFWKYRVGDYRILATFEEQTRKIVIVRIAHRRNVHRKP